MVEYACSPTTTPFLKEPPMPRLNERQIKIATEALEGAGECQSYSGRGMYGKTCISVQGSNRECGEIVAGAIQFMQQELVSLVHEERDAQAEGKDITAETAKVFEYTEDMDAIVLELLAHMKMDNMGRDMVMYWEQIPMADDAGDDDEDEDGEKE